MTRHRKGGFKKDGDFVEVTLGGAYSYQEVVNTACSALGIDVETGTESAVLMRMSGSRVLDLPIDTGSKLVPWTIMGYMRAVLSKSTKGKFGIALVEVSGPSVVTVNPPPIYSTS